MHIAQKFDTQFFAQNREALMDSTPNGFIVLTAHFLMQYSADTAFPFRQDQSFYYLTGLLEPELILVLRSDSHESFLFLPELSDYQKTWEGDQDTELMAQTSGIKNILHKKDLRACIGDALQAGLTLYTPKALPTLVDPYNFYANPARKILEDYLRETFRVDQIEDCRSSIARLRSVKKPVEIEAIRKAIEITGKAMGQARSRLAAFTTEKELENALTAAFFAQGADGHAFEPIVASGKNAAIIHSNKNRDKIAKNEGLLLDIGAAYHGYAADISRVWCVGTPSKKLVAMHAAVRELQQLAFSLLKPGVLLRDYQQEIEKQAQRAMRRLGMKEADKPFPHGISHFLGLDVHDAGVYDEPLTEGMVITVEPGLYSASEGIGVRLEDDVLLTATGIENLSQSIDQDLVY